MQQKLTIVLLVALRIELMKEEIWLPVKGWEIYKISSYGRLKRENKILSGGVNNHGYRQHILYMNGKKQQFYAHRLVAMAFLENPENKYSVNHKDGNKLNNVLSNLEWATMSENTQHAYDNGLAKPNHKKGARISADKRSVKLKATHKKTGEILTFKNSKEAADFLKKGSGGNIRNAATGKIKSAYGYYWEHN